MEDYGSGDKSELDILLRQDSTLFYIEVKALTNPNNPNVKREIVRNYVNLRYIAKNGTHPVTNTPLFTQPIKKIITILLYSVNVYKHYNKRNFNYMNNKYLYIKCGEQKSLINDWQDRNVKFSTKANPSPEDSNFNREVSEIAKKIDHYFLTWNDVHSVIDTFNSSVKYKYLFNRILAEMNSKTDEFLNDIGNYLNLKLL